MRKVVTVIGVRRRGDQPGDPGENEVYLDNRGLEPPEPMLRILSALDRLTDEQVLLAHTDRRPLFLLPQLEERGYAYRFEEQRDGTVITRIWRKASRAGDAAGAGAGSGTPAGDAATAAAAPGGTGDGSQAGPEPLVLDVRHYHAEGREPFGDIMAAVERLQPGQAFVLINTFEPVPLYRVMERKGFRHAAERTPDGDWRITFWRP